MVIGTGIDIVEIERIDHMIKEYGMQFLAKVFTSKEIEWCMAKAHPATHFAGRWAVKEAFYKALSDSCQSYSSWKSIEILPNDSGKRPMVRVCDEKLQEQLHISGVQKIHCSISHERSVCTAIILLERLT